MTQAQTIEDLKRAQKATHKIADKKKARTEFDRLAGLIADAEHEGAYEASQAEARAEEDRKQADRDLRQRNLDTFKEREAAIKKARERSAKIVDSIRQLAADLKEQREALYGFNFAMRELDPREDYSNNLIDWGNGLFEVCEHHGIPRPGMAASVEPVSRMTDALDRLANRIAYVKARAKLPQ